MTSGRFATIAARHFCHWTFPRSSTPIAAFAIMIPSVTRHSHSAVTWSYRLCTPPHNRILAIKQKTAQSSRISTIPSQRQFSQSARRLYPRKDSQDKDSINTEATEYSKSATDDEGARQGDAAFNPDITDPQQQKDVAGEGTEGTVSERVRLPLRHVAFISWPTSSFS